jgi:hypothetical protein
MLDQRSFPKEIEQLLKPIGALQLNAAGNAL